MQVPTGRKQRWVISNVDEMTVRSVKVLAGSGHYSMGYVLDMAVEYFSRKIVLEGDKPLQWSLPDDY